MTKQEGRGGWKDCHALDPLLSFSNKHFVLRYNLAISSEAMNFVKLHSIFFFSFQRVMQGGFFLLLRFFLRVDGVLVRINDTRIYHKVIKRSIRRKQNVVGFE